MKLTGNSKKQVDGTDNMDEKGKLMAKTEMRLADDELEQVSGGKWKVGPSGLVYWVDDESEPGNLPPEVSQRIN